MNDIALPQNQAASQGTVIEQTRAAAEVAAAVRVARDFPRDETLARDQMLTLCTRTTIAERAFYEVPNRGAGLSIHIARELARIWGNVDYGVRELSRGDTQSEMQVWAWDQETNVRSTRSFIQPHQRMKGGNRQNLTDLSDIYLANQNTGARAVRECIFTMLPGWFLAEAETRLKQTLRDGEGKSPAERIADAIARFEEVDVTQKQLEDRIGRPVANWLPKDLATLARIYSTITMDGIPIGEFFPEQAVTIPAPDEIAEGQS